MKVARGMETRPRNLSLKEVFCLTQMRRVVPRLIRGLEGEERRERRGSEEEGRNRKERRKEGKEEERGERKKEGIVGVSAR